MKNKMKDSEVESEKWWEVVEKIFYKGVREEFCSTRSWWKNYEVQVINLSKEVFKFHMW